MTTLEFSDAIVLSDNQRGSVVVDGISKTQPKVGNYGLLLKENEEDVFDIKMIGKPLNIDRDLKAALTPSKTDANEELTTNCADNLDGIFNFTVKTFPHYGAYGYVNYKNGDAAVYRYGETLENNRGGDIFNEAE